MRGENGEIRIRHQNGAQSGSRQPDELIAELAERQFGRVARRQLLNGGIGRRVIARRLARGWLHLVHPGVYAVAHLGGGPRAVLMAAWLYGGEGAVLSGRGGSRFWGFGEFAQIDLTVPATRRARGDIVFHRGAVASTERVVREGMAVATPARTLLDLAALVPEPRMRRVYREAEVMGLIDQAAVCRILAAHPRRRGAPLLRSLAGIDGERHSGRIRSHLEADFRGLVADHGLPAPEANVRLELGADVYEVDFLWRRQRIVVEVDGRSTHDNGARFDSDRERDRRLAAHGWRPVRVTASQLARPGRLREDLQMLLAHDVPRTRN